MSTLTPTKNHPAGPRSEGELEAGAVLLRAEGGARFDATGPHSRTARACRPI